MGTPLSLSGVMPPTKMSGGGGVQLYQQFFLKNQLTGGAISLFGVVPLDIIVFNL